MFKIKSVQKEKCSKLKVFESVQSEGCSQWKVSKLKVFEMKSVEN